MSTIKCFIVARHGARLADEERGAAKRRGRGLGQRNLQTKKIKQICIP